MKSQLETSQKELQNSDKKSTELHKTLKSTAEEKDKLQTQSKNVSLITPVLWMEFVYVISSENHSNKTNSYP